MRLALAIVLTLAAAVPQDRFLEGVLRPDEVTVRPKVLAKRLPPYVGADLTGPAGELRVEFIVERDGSVRDARVTQRAGPKGEFERETLAIAKVWKFEPALKDGAAVRMVAAMVVTFRTYQPSAATGITGTRLSASAVVLGVDDEFAKGIPMFAPGMVSAHIRKQVTPTYPSGLLRDKLPTVRVQIEAVVTADGALGDMRIIQSSDSRFEQAAVDAVRQWTFEPATLEGKAVASRVVVELGFNAR